jgi:hypothetical protein
MKGGYKGSSDKAWKKGRQSPSVLPSCREINASLWNVLLPKLSDDAPADK